MTAFLLRIGRPLAGWICGCLAAMVPAFLILLAVGGAPSRMDDFTFIFSVASVGTVIVAAPGLIIAFVLEWIDARRQIWPMLGGAFCAALSAFGVFLLSAAEPAFDDRGIEIFSYTDRILFGLTLFISSGPIGLFGGYVHWRVAIQSKG